MTFDRGDGRPSGDAALDQHIIADPVTGWSSVPHSQPLSILSYLDSIETAAVGPYGATASCTAEG